MPKSTKAIKVSDLNKAWNRKSRPSTYRIDSIPVNTTILITCEGQTEKLYFESFPVLGVRIEVVDLKGQSKLKLVESTKEMIDQSDQEFNQVWCVFDMDVKRGDTEFADFDNAIKKAFQLGYSVAYSNDSFELWFYLHFDFIETKELRTFYYKELGKKFGLNYIREGKKFNFCLKIYKTLDEDKNASQIKAIDRARKLYLQQQDLPFHSQNPVTRVYALVEELNKNLRR